jgi:hypothetical protein
MVCHSSQLPHDISLIVMSYAQMTCIDTLTCLLISNGYRLVIPGKTEYVDVMIDGRFSDKFIFVFHLANKCLPRMLTITELAYALWNDLTFWWDASYVPGIEATNEIRETLNELIAEIE